MCSNLFPALFLCASTLVASGTQAQTPNAYAAADGPTVVLADTATPGTATPGTSPTPLNAPAMVLYTGHVSSAVGPLPGAVVKITGTNAMAVTDADGFFHVAVPANTALQATASYAGFADETVPLNRDATAVEVRLNTARVVRVDRSQRLKTYLKTTRKQTKQNLRRIHR